MKDSIFINAWIDNRQYHLYGDLDTALNLASHGRISIASAIHGTVEVMVDDLARQIMRDRGSGNGSGMIIVEESSVSSEKCLACKKPMTREEAELSGSLCSWECHRKYHGYPNPPPTPLPEDSIG